MGKIAQIRRGGRPIERLSGSDQYRSVLSHGLRRSSRNFLLRARVNGLGRPRLGIVVTRKAARRSVDRNRGKRLLREFFRLQAALGPLDIVIQIRSDLHSFSNAVLRAELSALTEEIRFMTGFSLP